MLGVSLVIAASGCTDGSLDSVEDDVAGPMGEAIASDNEAGFASDGRRPVPMACGTATVATTFAKSIAVASSPARTMVFGLEGARSDAQIVVRSLDRGEVSSVVHKLRPHVSTVTATYAGDELVVASTNEAGAVFLDRVDPALDKFVELAKIDGDKMARTAIVAGEQGSWLVPTIDYAGVTLTSFDHSFGLGDVKLWETEKSPMYVAASNYASGGSVVGWSTDRSCHLAFATNAYTTVASSIPGACFNLQLAADRAAGGAMVVFDTAEGNLMFAAAPHNVLQPAQVLRHLAAAPHLAFDGSRYWIGFLDLRGQAIVGYYEDGAWTTAALPTVRPHHDAFDLAIVDGMPYLITGDEHGYTSHRICTQ